MRKKLNTHTSEISASPDFTAPASVVLFLGTRALFFNFFFPRNGNISMATGHRATIPPGMHAARLIHQRRHPPPPHELQSAASNQPNKQVFPAFAHTGCCCFMSEVETEGQTPERFFYMWPSYLFIFSV